MLEKYNLAQYDPMILHSKCPGDLFEGLLLLLWRHGGLMVSALASGWSDLGSSIDQEYCYPAIDKYVIQGQKKCY